MAANRGSEQRDTGATLSGIALSRTAATTGAAGPRTAEDGAGAPNLPLEAAQKSAKPRGWREKRRDRSRRASLARGEQGPQPPADQQDVQRIASETLVE